MREPGEPPTRRPARVQKGDRSTGYTIRKAEGVTAPRDPLYNWLPKLDRLRTCRLLPMRLVVPWDRVALGLELPVLPGKPLPNPVVRARQLQKALAEHGTASEVARALGLTRAGVCQYLGLLRRLPADLLDRVEAEEEPARLKEVSLRKLMAIAKMERAGERRQRLQALVKRM